jgi:hypothetical protein
VEHGLPIETELRERLLAFTPSSAGRC